MSAKEVRFSARRARQECCAESEIARRRGAGDALGPKGRNVVLDKSTAGAPRITKDGVTVAKEIRARGQVREHGRA